MTHQPHIHSVLAPADAIAAAEADSRIVEIATYPDGWVPNSYRFRAPGRRVIFGRADGFAAPVRTEAIDRKRSNGRGPDWVGITANGGYVRPRRAA